jgi:hypothetical protein
MTMRLEENEQSRLAEAAGHVWAESVAETLADTIPAINWPAEWDTRWSGKLPFRPGEIGSDDIDRLIGVAARAAAERWSEILNARRSDESPIEQQFDEETRAIRLLEAIESDLPEGLTLERDGPRVYVRDEAGVERTIDSLEQAWRAVSEWRERHSL